MIDSMSKDDAAIKRAALLVATLTSFLTPFMGSSVNIALPSIGREFNMNAVLLGWIATSYLLAAAMFLVPFGRIADIYGRKRIFINGILTYAVSSFLSSVAPSAVWLLAFRVLQGIGSAMIFGTGIAILTSVYPVGERGRVLGINVAAVYSGLSLGPFLGGFLTQHLGWRSIFFLNVPLSLIIIAFVLWKLKGEWAEAKGEKFDLTGSIIYILTLPAMMYGLSLLPATAGVWLILLGVLGLIALAKWEMKVKSPVLDMNLFRNNTVFAFSSLAAFINYGATFAIGFLLSLYLQYTKGLDPQHAGFILVSQPAVMALFSPLSGRLSDKIEPRIVASIGMGFTAMGLFLFTFLNSNTGIPFVVISLIVVGFGLALFSSPNTNAIMSSVEKRFYGVAAATVGTMRLTGQMFSMGISMLVLALYMGNAQVSPENYPLFLKSTKSAFIIFTALCFAGIFASLSRGKVR
ncbi:MAG: MFS transporter [candidate division Zixibacteria bacterium SM23_73_2]|nr:MAG: MFS transporter [candidate division Zixibacteria bacterium SM23_73_2]